jgi:4-carboxymuconolactone decarboxylase
MSEYFSSLPQPLKQSDPDFVAIFDNFFEHEVLAESPLDERTQFICELSALIGCLGVGQFKQLVKPAMDAGLEPESLKELVYMSVPYVGSGRALMFLKVTNEVFEELQIEMPLESTATVTPETRAAAGVEKMAEVFGDHVRDLGETGPEDTRHMNRWLANACFGDYYTRGGLTTAERELVALCLLLSQGGCEGQLAKHVGCNARVGNDEKTQIAAVSVCVPFIGFPRVWNAVNTIHRVLGAAE